METELAKTDLRADGQVGLSSGRKGSMRRVVTDRDRELMALMSITRYLTTEQANSLVRPGRDESVGRRRLFALAGLAPKRRAARERTMFDPPYLRRLQFRRTTGERVDLWGLTRLGEALAAELLGREPHLERNDVSEPYREHWVVLTELFVGLVAPLLARGTSVQELPLRWDPSESTELPWREYDIATGKTRARMMVPDAVLELPTLKRRLLIECEMGSHSIVANSDEKCGATLRKIERYDDFFGGFDDATTRVTFYEKAFPDRWPAEVVLMVRTASRRDSVNAALRRWSADRVRPSVAARAVTLAEAITETRALVGIVATPPKPNAPLGSGDLDLLRSFYQQALLELRATGRSLSPAFREVALKARTLLAVGTAGLAVPEDAR